MTRYYKLFDLLNRKEKKLSDLRNILSSSTVAKLRKGEHISGEAIEKICIYLGCQPGDIMEIFTETESITDTDTIMYKPTTYDSDPQGNTFEESFIESKPKGISVSEADENSITKRQY